MQLHKLSFYGLLCLLFLFSSCEKENDETWYFYDETKCADVWLQYPLTATLEGMVEFHFSMIEEVTIDEVQIVDDGAVEQLCEACFCTTGTRIRVRAAPEFQAAMEAEGFELE